MRRTLRSGLLAATSSVVTAAAWAQVVPSGSTATTVTTSGSGQQTVSIAPVLPGGLSYNAYNSFSVGRPGVDLDNRSVGARTIVNEVVTTNRSVIGGPVAVLGGRAHLIIANPNGITVDGGSFVNAGGVVLGAGTISLPERNPAPFVRQTNAVLNVSGSDVFVAAGGLGGTMASLQVYAGRVRVDGPVTVRAETTARAAGDIQVLAGPSAVEFDSAVLPIAALGTWASVTRPADRTTGEVVVDVTSRGSLEASRVLIGVTEKGAGVSYAGRGLTSAGEFRIDGSGQIGFQGAEITAAGDIRARGASITVLNAPERQSKLISVAGALTMLATDGDLRNVGGLLQGETINGSDPDSRGAVTLSATGSVELRTDGADRLAVAFASDGDLVVTAGGEIRNVAGRLLSNRATSLTAGLDVINTVETVAPIGSTAGVATSIASRRKGRWYNLWRARRNQGFSVSYGGLAVPGVIPYIVGSGVEIRSRNLINRGGEIDANDGSIAITTGMFGNDGVAIGSARFDESCRFLCRSHGVSDIQVVGGRLNAARALSITAIGGVTNFYGQWLALDSISIAAASFRVAGLPVISISNRPAGLAQAFGGGVAWATTQDAGGVVLAPNGAITITAAEAVSVDGGLISGVTVSAPSGIVVTRPPTTISPTRTHRTGLFNGGL